MYTKEVSNLSILPILSLAEYVSYSVDGVSGPVRHWDIQWDTDTETSFAPSSITKRIIDALLEKPRTLVITIDPDGEYPTEMTFRTLGFKEASKPILQYCGS